MKKSMVFEGVVAMLLILLLFIAYLMVSGGSHGGGIDSTSMVSGIYQGKDRSIYAFAGDSGNTIYAIDGNGDLKWTAQVPDRWNVYNPFERQANELRSGTYDGSGIGPFGRTGPFDRCMEQKSPVFSMANGYLYLCVSENTTSSMDHDTSAGETDPEEGLMAISPQGRILWTKNISRMEMPFTLPFPTIGLYANNGSIYLFANYSYVNDSERQSYNGLQVLNEDGSLRFTLQNLSGMPAVDESGDIYAVPLAADPRNQSIVKAYYPNGTLRWQRNIAMPIGYHSKPFDVADFPSLPLYSNHTLYVPVANGLWALGMDGSVKWTRNFNDGDAYLLDHMPVDAAGNVYFQCYPIGARPYVDIITTGGGDIALPMSGYGEILGDPATGTLYGVTYLVNNLTSGVMSPDDLISVNLAAYDPINDRYIWNRTFAANATHVAIDRDDPFDREMSTDGLMMSSSLGGWCLWNVKLLPWDSYNESISHDPYHTMASITPPNGSEYYVRMKVVPGSSTTFVNYYAANYEMVGYDAMKQQYTSNCTYANVLYALADNGTVIWERPLGSYVTSMASANGTVFYSTGDGRLNMAPANQVAGGITAIALIYVFIRFFLAGFVVRAKGRLDKNDNRNAVLQYVADTPGSTLREVSRGLGMNLGTVRYHMFILGINHRVVPYMADDKHVRYFTNSGTYGEEEQFVISLMRREGVRKILVLLATKPRLTNQELSGSLGIPESAMSRYMKELLEKGVVEKEAAGNGAGTYAVKDEYREIVVRAMGRP